MAKIIGCVGTSHIPAIGGAIHKGIQQEPYWKPFFDGFPPIHNWLGKVKPDVVVIFYNDHGLNFFLDKMPTFAVGAAAQTQQKKTKSLRHKHRPNAQGHLLFRFLLVFLSAFAERCL